MVATCTAVTEVQEKCACFMSMMNVLEGVRDSFQLYSNT